MKKLRLIAIITISIMIMIMAIIFGYSRVKAEYSDRGGYVSFEDFKSNPEMYCRDHGSPYKDQVSQLDSSLIIKSFNHHYTDIEDGKLVTKYASCTKRLTGKLFNFYYPDGSGSVETDPYDVDSTFVGYVANAGRGYGSPAQQVIWSYASTFSSVLGANVRGGSGGSKVSLSSEAMDFAKKNAASISSSSNKNVTCENYKIPINVKLNGQLASVTVYYTDGSHANMSKVEYNGSMVSIGSIKGDDEKKTFNVLNNSSKEVDKITIKTVKQSKRYKVSYELYRGVDGIAESATVYHSHKDGSSSGLDKDMLVDLSIDDAYDPQDVMRLKVEKSWEEETQDECTINVTVKKGNLQIVKQGYYGIEGKPQNLEALKNVNFKIRLTYTKNGAKLTAWVVSNNKKTVSSYTTDSNKATVFTTNKNGIINVNKLYSGQGYVYSIVEVGNDNPYYNDPMEIKESQSSSEKDQKVSSWNGYQIVTNVTINYGKTNTTSIKDNRTSGDLTITKQDSIYNDLKLKGAEFKIKLIKASNLDKVENMWLTIPKECNVKGSTYDYSKIAHDKYLTSDLSKADIFTTDENGIIDIKRIVNGTYQIYETKTPVGYDITKQEGYDPENKWVDCGTIEVTTDYNLKKYVIDNYKRMVGLKGMVWVEGEATKDGRDAYDSVYYETSDELLKEEIPVTLYQRQRDEKGNLIPLVTDEDGKITSGAVEIATTTLKDGYYEFTSKNSTSYTGKDKYIYYWDLADCFVEFIYDNKHQYNEVDKTYDTAYITADYLQKAKVKDEKTGEEKLVLDMTRNSKAQEYNATPSTLNDDKLGGIQEEIKGRAITTPNAIPQTLKADSYKEILEREGKDNGEILTTYYNNDTYCVENINLGLQNKYKPSFLMNQNIAYIKVTMNGYEYKYVYGGTAKELKTVPTVNEQNSARTFTASIYPSDIAYNKEAQTDELKLYVVYRIDVTNTTQQSGETLYDNVYEEQKMYLSSLTESYDHDRYELNTDTAAVDDEVAINDFALWSEGSEGANYDIYNEKSVYKNGITNKVGENTISSYVQYRVKDDALQAILNYEVTYEQLEREATKATATTYHEYIRTDNIWHDDYQWKDDIRAFEGHRENGPAKTKNDSNDQTYFLHKSVERTGNSPGVYLLLQLPEKERTISGTVFNDERTPESEEDNTNLGNGKLDENEKYVNNVTVELLQKNAAGEYGIATLYQLDGNRKYQGTKEASTTSNEKGYYEFAGVVPGEYYIRFTYGDGTQKLCDVDGNEIQDSEIYSNQYRSTIITEQNIKEAKKNEPEDLKATWYKNIEDKNVKYSVATDDLTQRSHDQDAITEDTFNAKVAENINAYSPKTSITIEDDEEGNQNEGEAKVTDDGNMKNVNYEVFDKFHFGIIKEIETILTLNKKMVNLSLTASQGTTFVNSNPKDQEEFVSDLDKVTDQGSKYSKIEMDANSLYGSTLKTKYEITVENTSCKDYVEDAGNEHYGWYYNYGEITDDAKPKKVTVKEITDNLDSKYTFDSTETDESKLKVHMPNENGQEENIETTEAYGGYEYKELVFELVENDAYDDSWKLASNKSDETSQLTFNYTVNSTLSASESDTEFLNEARITSIRIPKLTSLRTEFEFPKDHTRLIITPPTGENRSNGYWIIGVIAIIVLAGGIIIIKKKILK